MMRRKDDGEVHRKETEAKRWDNSDGSRATEVVVFIDCGVVVGSCSDDLDLSKWESTAEPKDETLCLQV